MNNKTLSRLMILLAVASIGFTTSVFAEDIRVPVGQQSQDGLEVPKTGLTKTAVKEKFGIPLQESAPVGNPPITRWTYNEFVVYFEYDHVIRSVQVFHRKESTETVISE